MAVTAETIRSHVAEIDYRPPESEIYGRSLTTIYRLGSFAVGKEMAQVVHSPEAEQARAEFYTSVEEGFGTDMKLGGSLEVRDFDARPIIGGRVMAKDLKTSISDMTQAGLVCAQEKATRESTRGDYRFQPQLTRSYWDHQNALLVDQMSRGETAYNTRIVISPFPEEAAAKSGNAYWRNIGYVPHLKRGFVQLYHMTEEGLVAGSLSFDGSSKKRLQAIFAKRGIDIPDTEVTDNWLQYAITDTLSKAEAKSLALEIADQAGSLEYKKTTNTVDVTSQHRSIMDKVFNQSYVHACESFAIGRQTPGARKLIFQLADRASHFNRRYAKALYGMRANENRFNEDDMAVLHELLVYSTIEMMRALHLKKGQTGGAYVGGPHDILNAQNINSEHFQRILSHFGAQGAIHNRVYSACGLSISLGGEETMNNEPQRVFGGLSKEELSWHGGKIKKGKCVNCHKDTDVGVASWCKKCIKC